MATNPHILVTGGAGYIGSNVCHALAQNGFTPVAYDDLSAGDKDRVRWGPLVVGDIRDTAALRTCMQQYKPAAVIHLAGMISVGESVTNPLLAYSINTQGTLSLLTAMRDEGVKTIIFSSTAAVYGIPSTDKVAESAPHKPINPYGWSKLFAEQMIADAAHAHGIGFIALRYFNASGANLGAHLGYARAQPLHLIPIAIRAMLSGKPFNMFGTDYPTADGSAIRDYIHIEDLAEAHVLALRHAMAGKPNLQLNLGTSKGYSVKEVIAQIEAIAGEPVPVAIAPRRAGDPACLVADAAQAQQVLNWQPKHSALRNIIETELAWHKSLSVKA